MMRLKAVRPPSIFSCPEAKLAKAEKELVMDSLQTESVVVTLMFADPEILSSIRIIAFLVVMVMVSPVSVKLKAMVEFITPHSSAFQRTCVTDSIDIYIA